MPKAAFEALKKEQGVWVAKGWDTEAKELMEDGIEASNLRQLLFSICH